MSLYVICAISRDNCSDELMMRILGRLITFDMLPDDVLLEMYDLYVNKYFEPSEEQL
jgi:hypothetical protein